jgi:DNA-binding NtrC family response regulator
MAEMAKILLVDDDPAVLFTLEEVLSDRGHRTVSAKSGLEALERLEDVDAVVTDLQMPGMDGLELTRAIRDRDRSLPVLLVTAHGNEKVAVSAMKAGAYDYLTKPFDIDEVALVVERALESRHLRVANRRLVAEQALGRRLIADSPPMRRLLDAVERLGEKDVTVLIRGETGTGKELIASLLHAHSPRSKKPFVRFNCAAIPAELAESELFGHLKGSFTGAQANRRGFFSEANGGTLVLDEIGELPIGVQAKLLRALQDGEIQPVGSARPEKVDVRVVASTNRDLRAEAAAGRFREDLYYRLAVVELQVPPLRDRRDDIPQLAQEFARRYAEKFGLDELKLSEALLARLRTTDWPGNVRQLENTVARLAALSSGGVIDVGALDPLAQTADAPAREDTGNSVDGPSLREQVEAFERNLIARALQDASGNQSEAARRLGTSRVTLIDKIRKHGLR